MKTEFSPMGARLLVKEIVDSLNVEERAKRAGLIPVVIEANRPRITKGRVVALGTDPLVHETYQIGDIVEFGPYAGKTMSFEGEDGYRSLTIHEIEGRYREVSDPPPAA